MKTSYKMRIMKNRNLFAFMFLSILMSGLGAQVNFNTSLLSTWDDPDVPSKGVIRYNDIWGYEDDDGNEFAIMGSTHSVVFIDITDPSDPTLVDEFLLGDTVVWRDIKTYGHHAYAVSDGSGMDEGLAIFDLSDLPNSVSKVSQSNSDFSTAHNIFVDEAKAHLYVVGITDRGTEDLLIYDLGTNPAAPTLTANLTLTAGYIHDIFVRNGIAFASHGNNGLRAYDCSSGTGCSLLGSLTTYTDQGYNHSSWLHDGGDYLVMADETHGKAVKIVDVTDLTDMTVESTFKSTLLSGQTNSIPHNPFVKGSYIYTSYYHDGLQIYDMSDPSNPTNVAYYDTQPSNTNYSGYDGAWGVYPFLSSNVIIGSDTDSGLYVIELAQSILDFELLELEANLIHKDMAGINFQVNLDGTYERIILEQSADGINYRKLTSFDVKNFSGIYHGGTEDFDLARDNYYRLKLLSVNGYVEYSEVELLKVENVYTDKVFPSPVRPGGQLYLNETALANKYTSYQIFDTQGRLVRDMPLVTTVIDMPHDLSDGHYVIRLRKEGQSFEQKLQVLGGK